MAGPFCFGEDILDKRDRANIGKRGYGCASMYKKNVWKLEKWEVSTPEGHLQDTSKVICMLKIEKDKGTSGNEGKYLLCILASFYIIDSSQHSGTSSPKMAATVGATFARPKLPSLMVYLVVLS